MFGNKAASAGLPPARERPGSRPPGRGRAGGLERRPGVRARRRGLAGWGARTEASSSLRPRGGWAHQAPLRPARGVVADSRASPGLCSPEDLRTHGARVETRTGGGPGCLRPGERAASSPLGLGEKRILKEGFKGEARPGGRWEGRVSSQPLGRCFFCFLSLLPRGSFCSL